MTAPVANKFFIVDQAGKRAAVERLAPMELRPYQRGWEPSELVLHTTDNRFDGFTNPVTLEIETHDTNITQKAKVELKNWFIVLKRRKDEKTYELVLRDVREVLRYGKLTASYNIDMSGARDQGSNIGTRLRQDSSDNGVRWKGVDAVKHALEKLITSSYGNSTFPPPTVEIDQNIDQNILNLILPPNLGTAPGGGFAGESYFVALPMLAESLDVDIRPTMQGNLKIVDRRTDRTSTLMQHEPTRGRIEERKLHWMQPGEIKYQFANRIERRFEYAEPGFTTAVSKDKQRIENVIPAFQEDQKNAVLQGDYLEFFKYVEDQSGWNANRVRDTILLDGVFPWEDQGWINALKVGKIPVLEYLAETMPATFRRLWRVRKDTAKGAGLEDIRPYIDLTFGRINADGTTRTEEAVYMDHVRIRRFARFNPGEGPKAGGTIFQAKFSDNVPFEPLRPRPAPFEVDWVSDDPDELVFFLTPRARRGIDAEILPGLLVNPLGYGTVTDLVTDGRIATQEGALRYRSNFKLQVYYHGLQIADTGAANGGRLTQFTRQGIAGGQGPALTIFVEDLTANYGVNTAYTYPGTLLNQAALDERMDYLAEQVVASYQPGKHGTLKYSGVGAVKGGVETSGNIHDVVITIGSGKDFEINTFALVAPEIRQIRRGDRPKAYKPAELQEAPLV